ncbi:response regulator [Streptosporangium subroseum]|uniref:response regulator n=1 Tax=Streptosporangium subroseum TaxID=106412 RepID=UPI003087B70B|nr:response regulator transcription factor [Streptosporangium subroseum]
MITVLLVDDHAVVRYGLRLILESHPDIQVVGQAADGREAISRTRELRPDVILMDIHMPELDGVAAIEQIMAVSPGVRVLALSTFDLDEYVVGALRAGASGFLPKEVSPEELVEGVRVVYRGDSVVAPRLLTRLIGAFVRPSPRTGGVMSGAVALASLGLSEREREVLTLIAKGHSNADIAEALGVAVSTVKNHVTNLFAKVGVHDRAQAVIVAYEAGLVTPGA